MRGTHDTNAILATASNIANARHAPGSLATACPVVADLVAIARMIHSLPTCPLTRIRTSFDNEVGKTKRFEIHAIDHQGKTENYADGFGK